MLAETQAFELRITNEEELSTGRNYRSRALFGEKPRKKGWIFTLDYLATFRYLR
jgi:hypothetical protein